MRPVLWITLLAFVVLIMGLLAYMAGALAGSSEKAPPDTPGGSAFDAANKRITKFEGADAFGNDPEALALANAYSANLKAATEATFAGGKRGSVSLTKGRVLTHCELRDGSVAFLVHVPELRQYKGEVRDALAEVAWMAAGETLREHGVDRSIKLAVALRGALLYGPVMAGEFDPGPMNPPRPTFNGAGADGLTRVYPFFVTPTTAPASQPATMPALTPPS
jgi:hypothetical protein